MYLIIYIILFVIIIFGVRITSANEKKTFVETSNNNANKLRGVFAIIIIIAHCTLIFDKLPVYLIPFRKISTLCVGYFFVMSGYGLAYSYEHKKNYLDNFLINKLLYIFIVSTITITFGSILDVIFKVFFKDCLGLVAPNWYIFALTVGYIIYYICYKFFKDRKRNILIFIITIIITGLALILKLPRVYYISELAFPIGMLMYEYKEKINYFINEKKGVVIFTIVSIFAISIFSFKVNEYTMLDLILHNLLFIPFYFIILLVCYYYKFYNNIIEFLNKISFELYVYQFITMNFITKIMQLNGIERGLMYILIVISLNIIISIIMNKLNVSITNVIKKELMGG